MDTTLKAFLKLIHPNKCQNPFFKKINAASGVQIHSRQPKKATSTARFGRSRTEVYLGFEGPCLLHMALLRQTEAQVLHSLHSTSGLPVVGAEGGGAIAQPPVQHWAVVLCQQVWVRGLGGLWITGGGENRAVGWRRGGGLSGHLLIGRQLQRRQET